MCCVFVYFQFLLKPEKVDFRPKFRKKGANKAGRFEQRKQGVRALKKKDTIETLKKKRRDKFISKKKNERKFGDGFGKSVLSRFVKTVDTG